MQQLLTGKTRLPQFATYTEGEKQGQPKGTKSSELGEIPEDWDVIEFGNCIRTVIDNRGKTPPLTNDGLPMLEVNAVFKQGRSPNLKKVTKYVSQYTYDNWFRDGHPKHGDILVVTVGSAGETSYVDKEGYCIAQNLISLRLSQNFDNAFVYYITTSTQFKKQVEAVLMGAVQPSLKVPHLKKFKTLIPVTKEEQTAIATILSDMDSEIQTLELRLAKTRQIKQGMMQELLTGRTRLPFKKES
ncbi:restriction endonuclease subunit S [Vibrio parahaemolyticus]|nr:restriction endonuclease subunit S [Vibrio parahaemolyticus]